MKFFVFILIGWFSTVALASEALLIPVSTPKLPQGPLEQDRCVLAHPTIPVGQLRGPPRLRTGRAQVLVAEPERSIPNVVGQCKQNPDARYADYLPQSIRSLLASRH